MMNAGPPLPATKIKFRKPQKARCQQQWAKFGGLFAVIVCVKLLTSALAPHGDSLHQGAAAVGGRKGGRVLFAEESEGVLDEAAQDSMCDTTISVNPAHLARRLSFSVCNGFANQRIALLNGFLIALETNRTVVLPKLVAHGRQDDLTSWIDSSKEGVQFSDFYDVDALTCAMRKYGVSVISSLEPFDVPVEVPDTEWDLEALRARTEQHIQLGCPLLRLHAKDTAPHEQFVYDFFKALVPKDDFKVRVNSAVRTLTAASDGRFNFLHLRLEEDWIHHCSYWGYEDNCFANTLEVAEHLQNKGFEPEVPLYVGLDWDAADRNLTDWVMARIRAAGYRTVFQSDINPEKRMPREFMALLEYYIALAADKFIGNSVSSFAAMLLLERESRGLWASYYNMGIVPLADYMPFYRLPWVFTFNGASPKYDYLMRGAVLTSKRANLRPFCIYNGTRRDEMYNWLKGQGVEIIMHTPDWVEEPVNAFERAKQHIAWSPLFGSPTSIFGAYQRIDISVIPRLRQYNYVLYTDSDVMFRRPISLKDFGKPLPSAIMMAFERDNIFPCNSGVILMNLPGLRSTHDAFVKFAFAAKSLHFGKYGTLDQGALNQFYEREMGSACTLSEDFNAKPHKNYNYDDPFIVHFHGPKPHDYLEFKRTGKCGFGDLCAQGLDYTCRMLQESRFAYPTCNS